MRKKSILLIIVLIIGLQYSSGQKSKKIDKLKFKNYEIEVTFFDPYENIIAKNPEFIDLDSLKQSHVWNNYLLNNTIYDFKLNKENKTIKHYLLRGNSSKEVYDKNLTRNSIYQLDIVPHQNNINFFNQKAYSNLKIQTIDKVGFYGTLFDNMEILKNSKQSLGKNLFGTFRLKIPYSTIKNNIITVIGMDLFGEVDQKLTNNDSGEFKNSFFNYQACVDDYFKIERIKKTYVRTYDASGEIQNEYPRLNTDGDIKSFIGKMKRIGDVTSLPFFKSMDKPILIKKDSLKSSYKIEIIDNKPIEKYFEDIIVTKNKNDEIDNITATLLIHGSSITKGEYIERENYIAYFKKFESCVLPYKVLFSPTTDKNFERPRIEVKLDYLFHKK